MDDWVATLLSDTTTTRPTTIRYNSSGVLPSVLSWHTITVPRGGYRVTNPVVVVVTGRRAGGRDK